MDIRKWLYKYSKDCQLKYNSISTQINYTAQVRAFLLNFSEVPEPKSISNDDIKSWLLDAKTINTRKHRICAVKSFYQLTVGMNKKINSIPYPKSDKKLPIVLSQDEIQKMFSVCTNLKHKAILCVLYSAGLRVSEIINLKISHIDSSRMIINIVQAKGKKDRQVPLNQSVLKLLREYFVVYKPKDYLFNGWKDEPQYSERSIGAIIKQLAEKAGISKRVYTHLIRHCTFTHMVENGTDINLIQRIAGHNNVKTTSIYCHISHNLISKINSPINQIKL